MARMQENETEFGKNFDLLDDSSGEVRGTTSWAVPWSDLMMVMFVLFVVLYVYASTHQEVRFIFTDRTPPADAQISSKALDGIIARMTDRVDGHTSLPGLQDKEVFYKSHLSGVSVIREGEEVRVVLRGTDFFEQGRTELSPGGMDYLFEIAELMHLSQGPVEVIGFADAEEPSGVEGFSFSARRAASVAAYFINNTGIAPGRFSVTGKGEYSPEVPATTEHADESNRRVEIVIHTGQ